MAVLKMRDVKNMSKKEIEEKLKELRLELMKKQEKIRNKEIKKAIARLLTAKKLNSQT